MKSSKSLFENELQAKIVPRAAIKEHAQRLKNEGLTIATLNGSFDLLHSGHLYILFAASRQADVLIVALNTDSSIQKYKGKSRPIISLEHRAKMLCAIKWVSYVTFFDETDPREILKDIRPDVHVNGAEYGADCIEKQVVESVGGHIHLVDRIEGLSTSEIIKKIKQLCD